jgi:hypothetical protein
VVAGAFTVAHILYELEAGYAAGMTIQAEYFAVYGFVIS